jgi:hypothetical protein
MLTRGSPVVPTIFLRAKSPVETNIDFYTKFTLIYTPQE